MSPVARPRPVVELAGEAVAANAEDLAKRWAAELVLECPLEEIAELPLERLAREAPSLCERALGAVRSDAQLQSLIEPPAGHDPHIAPPAAALAAICGADDAVAAVNAVEMLRGVLWRALLERTDGAPAALLADVGDRLAYVCSAMLAVALATDTPATAAARITDEQSPPGALAAPQTPERRSVAGAGARVAIVDEAVPLSAPAPRRPAGERPLSWDESPPIPPGTPARGATEIEIRDERTEGPVAWIGSIGAQLERFAFDRAPFAVLLVELMEIERLRYSAPAEQLGRLGELLEQSLAGELERQSGALTRERPGRCWVVLAGTDRDGARRAAERYAHAASSSARDRGVPLQVAVGTAVCPEDGREAATLAAHADVALYAARAAIRTPSGLSGGRAPVDAAD